jgi:hypothetical protein
MTPHRTRVLVGAFGAILLTLAASTRAASLVQTVNIPPGTVVSNMLTSSVISYPIAAEFQQFQPSLGILNEVVVEYWFYFEATVTIPAGYGGGVSCGLVGDFFVNGVKFGSDGWGGGGGGGGPTSFTIPIPVPHFPPGAIPITETSDAAPFAEFSGTGSATVLWDLQATLNLSFPPDTASMDCLLVSPSYVRVTYDYTPCPPAYGDTDWDQDVDQDDFGSWQTCFTAAAGPTGSAVCRCLDWNHNLVIDKNDRQAFMNCWSGPAVPADPACTGL